MERSFLITSEYGIHARPATKLVNLAMNFHSEIDLTAMGKTINLKSIMGLMSLGIYKGELITIKISGSDEIEALDAISDFIVTENMGKIA
jgi:phosphocarrier protein HPr